MGEWVRGVSLAVMGECRVYSMSNFHLQYTTQRKRGNPGSDLLRVL